MTEVIASLISGAGGWIAAALALLAAIVGAFIKGRKDGRDLERGRQDRARIESIEDRRKADVQVRQMDGGQLDREYDRWVRNDKPR